MELNTLLVLLAILVCPISMGIMMWRMNKNMDDRHMHMKSDDSTHDAYIKTEKSDMPINDPSQRSGRE
jgi:hypothetical protein